MLLLAKQTWVLAIIRLMNSFILLSTWLLAGIFLATLMLQPFSRDGSSLTISGYSNKKV